MAATLAVRSVGAAAAGAGSAAQRADLTTLQREYRHMELNRRAYADESQQLLRKQQAVVDKLRRENGELKSALALEFRQFKKPADAGYTERVLRMRGSCEQLTASIEAEKAALKTTEEQIQLMRRKILEQRKAIGGVHAARESDGIVQRQVAVLENRLDKALTKFNEALATNKTLRAQIDDLRRERVVFDGISQRLGSQLSERKQQMGEVIEASNASYEQRDTAQLEMAAIEQANTREQDDFEAQMLELGRMLEEELNPTKFSVTAGASGPEGSMTQHEELSLKHRLAADAAGLSKEREALQAVRERIQSFEEAFNRIRAATGIEDVDELVRLFISNEDHNFSLFNYVNEQQNEIDALEEQLGQLKQEEESASIAQNGGESSGNGAHQQMQAVQELETRLRATEASADRLEKRCSGAAVTIAALKEGVSQCLATLGAPPDAEVTDSNLLQHMGAVEQRVHELLVSYASVREAEAAAAAAAAARGAAAGIAEDEEAALLSPPRPAGGASAAASVLGEGPITPMGQEPMHVNPPRLEDCSSGDGSGSDADARPLTREELRSRALGRMQRQRARQGAKVARRNKGK